MLLAREGSFELRPEKASEQLVVAKDPAPALIIGRMDKDIPSVQVIENLVRIGIAQELPHKIRFDSAQEGRFYKKVLNQ